MDTVFMSHDVSAAVRRSAEFGLLAILKQNRMRAAS